MASLRRNISRNLALWLVGLIMVLLAGVVAFAYGSFRREATRQVLERDRQLAVLSASRLQSDLDGFADLLTAVARTPEMTEGGLVTRLDALREASPRLKVFDAGVVLLDDRGRIRGSTPERPELVAQDWSDWYAFQAVLRGAEIYASDALPERPGGPLVVAIIVPIHGEESRFLGALAGLFSLGEPRLSAFYGGIVRLRLGQGAETLVIDGHGRIIYAPDVERVGHFLTSAELPLIRSRQAAEAVLMKDRNDREVVAARAPIPTTNWTLATLADWAVVTQDTRRYRDILLIAFAAALLLPPLSLAAVSRQRRFRFFDVRWPDQDDSWARAVRDQILPTHVPVLPGWGLSVLASAGKRSEHEFIDTVILPDGRLLLTIGAVIGTGLPAAMAIASTRTLLRACGLRGAAPDDALRQCNAALCFQLDLPMPVKVTYVQIDPRTGWLDYACAGTGPPHSRGGILAQRPDAVGEAMGTSLDARVEVGRIHVEPGDLMVLLGPAMVESRDADGRSFVDEPLRDVLESERTGIYDLAEKIQRAFRAFNAGSSRFDPDLTIVCLERQTGSP